jgi:hypothetical protein
MMRERMHAGTKASFDKTGGTPAPLDANPAAAGRSRVAAAAHAAHAGVRTLSRARRGGAAEMHGGAARSGVGAAATPPQSALAAAPLPLPLHAEDLATAATPMGHEWELESVMWNPYAMVRPRRRRAPLGRNADERKAGSCVCAAGCAPRVACAPCAQAACVAAGARLGAAARREPAQRAPRAFSWRPDLSCLRRCAQAALPLAGSACAPGAPLLPALAPALDGGAPRERSAAASSGGAARRARARTPRADRPPGGGGGGGAARSGCQVVGCTTAGLRLNTYNKRVRRALWHTR